MYINYDSTECSLAADATQNVNIDISYAYSEENVWKLFKTYEYSVIFVEIQSSTELYLETLYFLRDNISLPILAIIPHLTVSDKIALFRAGVTAYLEKPVNTEVCVAQAHSLIQLYWKAHSENGDFRPLIFGTELIINPIYRQVVVDGELLELTRTEFDLFFCLAKHPGQVWSRSQLYHQVWSDESDIGGDNTVRAHIGNLRKKLADMGKNYIQTSWGVGYKFTLPLSI